MELAKRIANLPPYLFAEIDKKIAEKRKQGVDVISLGMGDPVEPTPQNIIDCLCQEAQKEENHRYPSYYGLPAFREEIARWYKKRFGVELNPDTEVLPLIGSKEGIAHIFLSLIDPGETALIPDPAYPVYNTGVILAGGTPTFMSLKEENGFNPDFSQIREEALGQAKLMFLNYPNNPTTGIASDDLFEQAIKLAKVHNFVICHDFAYSEIYFDGYVPPSILQLEGAKDIAVEFHSLSKTYNMTGWRCGFLVGCEKVVEALGRVKTNIDSGIFNAIQYAGIEALSGPQDSVRKMRQIYQRRRDLVLNYLKKAGLKAFKPVATVFVWVKVPSGFTSASFATHVLDKVGVVLSPGNAYGPSGEGYFRISLTVKDDRLEEALARILKQL